MEVIKDIAKAAIIWAGQNCMFTLARDETQAALRGPFLVIAPHPDDETLGCGAFIARARASGQTVRIVIVLDDDRDATHRSGFIAELRRQEALKASATLGVAPDNVVFLKQPDGAAQTHIDAIEKGLGEQVRLTCPTLVLSPYGEDKHSDHRAVAEAVNRLHRKGLIACPVYEYPIWFWLRNGLDHLLRMDRIRCLRRIHARAYVPTKTTAMKAHRSQYPKLLGGLSEGLFQPFSFRIQFFARYEVFFEKRPRFLATVPTEDEIQTRDSDLRTIELRKVLPGPAYAKHL
jgi:LmbE family N-acetylglucosaminyl deacetylase